ncbi:MAG: DUF4440 domain-containing protein [Candidatus Acidiferrales bacterium]
MWNMRFAGLLSCTVVCATLVAGCSTGTGDHLQPHVAAQPADTRASDEAAIRAASAAWSKASAAKDIDKAVSFYGDGAVVMSPKAPAVHDSENIRKGWADILTPGPGLSWRTTTVEVARSGELAYENGEYDFVTTDKNGKTNDEKGKYLVIWKKQADGAWKVAVDMDNTNE